MLLAFSRSSSNNAQSSVRNRRSNYSISFNVSQTHVDGLKVVIPEQIAEALEKDQVSIHGMEIVEKPTKFRNTTEVTFRFTTFPEHTDFRKCKSFMAWIKSVTETSDIAKEQARARVAADLKRQGFSPSSIPIITRSSRRAPTLTA